MATSARVAGVGAFVLGGIVAFAVGLFMIGDRQMAFAKKFTVYTEFSKITGLQPGAVVRVSGAKAGTIQEIIPPNTPSQRFRVKLELAETLHQLVRTDSVATIETEGLVGGSYLGISTGTDLAAPVAPDSTIAGKEPFDIADLMQQMGETVAKVNATFDGMKDEVQGAIVAVTGTMDSANALIVDVSGDVKAMSAAGARISGDAAAVTEGIRNGKGIIGKLMTDDELYRRATAIAQQTEETVTSAKQAVELAKKTLEAFQSKDGPIQGMTADVSQTMNSAREAMAAFNENMEALKRNFLVRGFFNNRGYFDLDQMSPAVYRQGALTKGGGRQLVRTWIAADGLFEADPERGGNERLSGAGKALVDAAIAPSLDHVASGIVVVEGYAQRGSIDERYLWSRVRASLVRDHLIGKFHLDPQATGAMPLGAESIDSPGKVPWDGVALAVILPKGTLAPRK